LHLSGDRVGDASTIERGRSGVRDQANRAGEGRLAKARADCRGRVVGKERCPTGEVLYSILSAGDRAVERRIDGETFGGQTNCRRQNFGDWKNTELTVRFEHPGHGTRNSRGLGTDDALAREL